MERRTIWQGLVAVWAMIARSDTSAMAAAVASPTAASARRIVAWLEAGA
jgi:hypothetical protein